MAKREKITNSSIKALIVEDKRVNDTEISGFHALISPKGKITYYLFYRLADKQVNYKLGQHGHITPAQARDLAKAKAGEVANGVDVQDVKKQAKRETLKAKHTKLETFLDNTYFEWLQTRNAKTANKTIKTIKTGFPQLLDSQLIHITAWEIEKWRAEKSRLNMKPATVNSYVNPLKGAMSRAVEWGLIESHDLQKVKALKVDNSRIRFLDKEEESSLRVALKERDKRIKSERENGNKFRQQRSYTLLPELRDRHFADHLEPLVLLAMNTGMRKSELFNLRWDNVDLSNSVVKVIAENAKSGKARHIPLNNEALETLHGWQKDTKKDGYVFEWQPNKPITDVKKGWNNLLGEAQISEFNFHDLRHHFASKLVMAGVDLNTVRELLGHANLDMTIRYAHLAPEHKAAAVNLIG
ncbi:site-specific integrase [uncultured Paraglaciecola sp.]|uniref:site-specific integrase n=1 Tax=uncultured Paraglaciecola sp. TaxID=1765024 RepID=UPI0030DB0F02|tara:strand:+ start:3373 stop:4608 length:1236 start_codon:yes stop_codon:yes gene_type:complete